MTIRYKSINYFKYDPVRNLSLLYISLTEGKNHEVKNIFQYFEAVVLNLKRIKMGSVLLDVGKGKYRKLSLHEISTLKKLTINNPKKG